MLSWVREASERLFLPPWFPSLTNGYLHCFPGKLHTYLRNRSGLEICLLFSPSVCMDMIVSASNILPWNGKSKRSTVRLQNRSWDVKKLVTWKYLAVISTACWVDTGSPGPTLCTVCSCLVFPLFSVRPCFLRILHYTALGNPALEIHSDFLHICFALTMHRSIGNIASHNQLTVAGWISSPFSTSLMLFYYIMQAN